MEDANNDDAVLVAWGPGPHVEKTGGTERFRAVVTMPDAAGLFEALKNYLAEDVAVNRVVFIRRKLLLRSIPADTFAVIPRELRYMINWRDDIDEDLASGHVAMWRRVMECSSLADFAARYPELTDPYFGEGHAILSGYRDRIHNLSEMNRYIARCLNENQLARGGAAAGRVVAALTRGHLIEHDDVEWTVFVGHLSELSLRKVGREISLTNWEEDTKRISDLNTAKQFADAYNLLQKMQRVYTAPKHHLQLLHFTAWTVYWIDELSTAEKRDMVERFFFVHQEEGVPIALANLQFYAHNLPTTSTIKYGSHHGGLSISGGALASLMGDNKIVVHEFNANIALTLGKSRFYSLSQGHVTEVQILSRGEERWVVEHGAKTVLRSLGGQHNGREITPGSIAVARGTEIHTVYWEKNNLIVDGERHPAPWCVEISRGVNFLESGDGGYTTAVNREIESGKYVVVVVNVDCDFNITATSHLLTLEDKDPALALISIRGELALVSRHGEHIRVSTVPSTVMRN